jgi:hypothetical protein
MSWADYLEKTMPILNAYTQEDIDAAVAAERERIAKHFDARDRGPDGKPIGIGFYDPHEPAEIIRALKPNTEAQGRLSAPLGRRVEQPTPEKDMTCQHKRYSVDVHEQTGQCIDCGAEGRISFVVPRETDALKGAAAAAHELLTALQAVLRWIDDNCETTGFEEAEALADAALAKAGAELFNTGNEGR